MENQEKRVCMRALFSLGVSPLLMGRVTNKPIMVLQYLTTMVPNALSLISQILWVGACLGSRIYPTVLIRLLNRTHFAMSIRLEEPASPFSCDAYHVTRTPIEKLLFKVDGFVREANRVSKIS